MHIPAQKIREAAESLSCTELETFMYQEPNSRRKSSRRRSNRRSSRRSTYRSTRRSSRRSTYRSTRRSSRRSTYRSTRRSSRHHHCQCGSPCCSYPWFNKSLGCCFKGHGCRR
ncbi:CotG/ExsB N-terminal domain-containing protein [Priestia megaterium]